jgi:2-(1,2-epoxy-1,2-dihydrophenyl)acetyl-CoA isomerase
MTETAAAKLLYSCKDSIARIHFNRPTVLNAIDAEVAQLFLGACRKIAADPGVRAVVLSGEGRAFVSGGDLKSFVDNPTSVPDVLIEPMHQGLLILTRIAAPVIASLKGGVAGAGMSLALGCDLAIAAAGTKFNLAYINVGTSSDAGASWSLPRIVGLRKALEISLLSEMLDVDEAARLGIVNRVVPAEELESATLQWATKLANGPTHALGSMKRLMRESYARGLEQQLVAEKDSFRACAATADFTEAVNAFLQKRPPRYPR